MILWDDDCNNDDITYNGEWEDDAMEVYTRSGLVCDRRRIVMPRHREPVAKFNARVQRALGLTREEFGEAYQLPAGDGWAIYYRSFDVEG